MSKLRCGLAALALLSLFFISYAVFNGSAVSKEIIRGLEQNDLATVKLALSKGAKPNGTLMLEVGSDYKLSNTPLVYAAGHCNADIVSELLANGASINQRSPNGWTALGQALERRRVENVQILIEAGAQVDHVVNSYDAEHFVRKISDPAMRAQLRELLRRARK